MAERHPHPSVQGGTIELCCVHGNLEGFECDSTELAGGDALRDTLLECFQVGPPLVDPRDEVEPTWVHARDDRTELLELSEALARVADEVRADLVAEHIEALRELVAHHRSVTDSHPFRYGAENPHCTLCIVDPESHAASLAAAIVWRTGELIDALTAWGPQITR